MQVVITDGGRSESGFKGKAGDCVCRAIAIAAELPYKAVYEVLAQGMGTQRKGKHGKSSASARNGITTSRKWFKDYMRSIGFEWHPTMGIGTGCRVHLHDGELPSGRLVVSVSKHYTAVIDGVIYDTHDPQRESHTIEPDNGRELKPGEWRNSNGICRIERRCVYGYWQRIA